MFGAVDVGGTKTLLAVFTTSGKLVKSVKFPTPTDYKDFKTKLSDQINELAIKKYQISAIAIPGKVDRSRGVGIAFGNLSWENVKIRDDSERLFHSPVVVENDSKLASLSESLELPDKYKKVLYLTISTGIGGGFVVNKEIDTSLQDSEVGQILLEHDGKLQRWEEFASGKAIVKKFGKQISEITDQNDLYAIAHNIAVGLIDLIATLTPDVVVIGGGVGEHLERFSKHLEEELKLYQNNLITIPPILKAKRPKDAVIYGCYQLAKNYYARSAN